MMFCHDAPAGCSPCAIWRAREPRSCHHHHRRRPINNIGSMARKRSLFNIFPLSRPRRESVIQRRERAEEEGSGGELLLDLVEREKEREEKIGR